MSAARWSLLLGSLLLLGGCRGKLITTATLHKPGTATAKFSHDGRKIALWADTDAKWNGPKNSKAIVNYEIDVKQGGKTVGHVSCSTGDRGGTTNACGAAFSRAATGAGVDPAQGDAEGSGGTVPVSDGAGG